MRETVNKTQLALFIVCYLFFLTACGLTMRVVYMRRDLDEAKISLIQAEQELIKAERERDSLHKRIQKLQGLPELERTGR
jgi:hypothetical protein